MSKNIDYEAFYHAQCSLMSYKDLELFNLKKENKQLKEQNEDLFNDNHELRKKLEHHIPEEQYADMLHIKNEQLKQRDEIIDEAIKFIREKTRTIPCNGNGEGGGIELVDYDIQKLIEILQRYKGDNK